MAQVHKSEIVSNNLANINTTGFKKDVAFFEILSGKVGEELKLKSGADFSQGVLKKTDNPLDIAISGKGFFTVANGDGEAYTRDGHFKIGQDGLLRTSSGNAVMGEGGLISVETAGIPAKSISITSDGEVYIDGEYRDRLLISDFESYDDLTKAGSNLFKAGKDVALKEPEKPEIQQGFLEGSNVNAVDEMMGLIEVQRQFETVQKMVRAFDDSLRLSTESLGKY